MNILNLSRKYSDADFEWWEWNTKLPSKQFKKQLTRNVIELAGDVGKDIIFLGCGSSPMINCFPGNKIGVDISREKLDFLATRTDAILVYSDILSFSTDKKFDTVFLTEVIEHVGYNNVDAIISKVSSLLKKGGKAVIATPDMGNVIGYLVETTLHRDIHTSLLFGEDLKARCRRENLVYLKSKSWIWDTAYLFIKGEEC